MWELRKEALEDGRVLRGEGWKDNKPLSVAEVISLWSEDRAFRKFFSASLAETDFGGFFWEMPPVTAATADRNFEFVLVEGDLLRRLHADPHPFANQFAKSQEPVLTFPNLGGDAVLVVPAPLAELNLYPHLAAFLRGAPKSQVDALWAAAGRAMRARLSDQPVWLSTAGLGVSWLHLRLDSRPKYYRYRPYKLMN